ncbi:hypothetical protein C5167_009914 [Papaver somniferum]|uniref:LRR repeats and ubiquitin-like domain-containing protein n=1 Tax=Papaver somniferum TaxID=3469 RepID=A0A4Y7K2M5_PAPSO|nr:hypothetical protein C5167_009914 [Papaver somniferum]
MEGRGEEEENVSAPLLNIQVKFSGRSKPLYQYHFLQNQPLKTLNLFFNLPLMSFLEVKNSSTKVLEDTMKLKSTDIINGSKLMLMASQGLHQGDGPITKQAVSSGSGLRKPSNDGGNAQGLMGSKVEVIPEEVWGCGSSIRVLDISRIFMKCLLILKLLLNENGIRDECISWEGVVSFLTSLPSGLGTLVSLTQLHVANNKLTSLPVENGLLTRLEILKDKLNSITHRELCSLVEVVDLASNHLVDLPDTIGNLRNIKALHLSNNGLKSLPSTLFKLCTQLSTLDLHNTEITIDILRQFEGWEAFDERRRLKHQKQLDFRVGSSGAFDEGADKN